MKSIGDLNKRKQQQKYICIKHISNRTYLSYIFFLLFINKNKNYPLFGSPKTKKNHYDLCRKKCIVFYSLLDKVLIPLIYAYQDSYVLRNMT